MEPTSNSQRQGPADRSGDRNAGDGEAEYVCKVCRQSIPPTADRRFRERLVHRACQAELRCGVTVDR